MSPRKNTDPTSRPLRVAVLGHTAVLSGAELSLLRMLQCVDRSRFDVRVVLFADGPLVPRLREAGFPVTLLRLEERIARVGRREAGRSILEAVLAAARALPFAVRLGFTLRAIAPDVVLANTLKADLLGLPASWIARRPLVWHLHDRVSADYLRPLVVRLLRFGARHLVAATIVNSQATAATVPGARRLAIAYPGISDVEVGPSPAERAEPERVTVTIVGRISPTKGQLEFVRAAAIVAARRPEVRFRIVGAALFGEDAYAEQVRQEATALELEDRLDFTGFVDDVSAQLDGSTVCVHASGTPEPFGQVIAQAMVRGVPVVATRGGGVTELVRPDPDGEPLGWLVPPHDPAALAAAILEVLESPAEAHRRASAAWASATDRFPMSRMADVVCGVWDEVALRRQGHQTR